MARPTSRWSCIAILALVASTFIVAHAVKPLPKTARPHNLQMDTLSEPETTNLQASGSDSKPTVHHDHSQVDNTKVSASGCSSASGGAIYGSGHGTGGSSLGFQTIFPFPGFPFGIIVPQVSTWGEGDGFGGSNNNPDTGTSMNPNCQCTNNGLPTHYVLTPVYFHHTAPASLHNTRRHGPNDVASGTPHN